MKKEIMQEEVLNIIKNKSWFCSENGCYFVDDTDFEELTKDIINYFMLPNK
tara:strand:- start:9 stop:161 length:153 start_codon:yes stop_codon:yes gene_type:complete